jgi:hypothetical protein
MADRDAKGRQASGLKNGAYTHPERLSRGEQVNTSKLTTEKVKEIRHRFATEHISCRTLAKQYGVGKSAIERVVNHQTWKHIP